MFLEREDEGGERELGRKLRILNEEDGENDQGKTWFYLLVPRFPCHCEFVSKAASTSVLCCSRPASSWQYEMAIEFHRGHGRLQLLICFCSFPRRKMLHEYFTRKEREEVWRMMAEGRNEEAKKKQHRNWRWPTEFSRQSQWSLIVLDDTHIPFLDHVLTILAETSNGSRMILTTHKISLPPNSEPRVILTYCDYEEMRRVEHCFTHALKRAYPRNC
ncbi:hypothetical protein CK203_108175 [Vitis vinifera]|uniref:Uncharacterized protein n=1 Tax=Vitis vinifera TaxID=29760 RepID=A0A438CQ89_VITVI|nr:hypothetical protein CK203_108175 [Vitis vinifera]